MSKVFPRVLSLPGSDARVTLLSDGSFTGSAAVLELYIAKIDGSDPPMGLGTVSAIMVWLLLRAMKRDTAEIRARVALDAAR